MARTKDMTAGSPVRLILGFAMPVLAGNLLQQLGSHRSDPWNIPALRKEEHNHE